MAEQRDPAGLLERQGTYMLTAAEFISHIAMDLTDMDREAGSGCPVPTLAAASVCNWLARKIADVVISGVPTYYATFSEDTGAVSLVLQSPGFRRRLNYQISPDGHHIKALCIDERMVVRTRHVSTTNVLGACELARWVIGETPPGFLEE